MSTSTSDGEWSHIVFRMAQSIEHNDCETLARVTLAMSHEELSAFVFAACKMVNGLVAETLAPNQTMDEAYQMLFEIFPPA